MPRWQRAHLAACAFVIAYALCYVGVDYLGLPRLVYLPHARGFVLSSSPPGPLEMGYVGLWSWALGAGLLAGGLLWLALGRRQSAVGSRALGLGTAWTVTAVLVAGTYYTWHNWP
jgi:hypothetical protein